MFLHKGQLVSSYLKPNPSLELQEHPSRAPLPSQQAESPAKKAIEIGR